MNDLIPFIVGGLVVGISTLLLKYVSPKTAAIFYAYPMVFVTTVAFMYNRPKVVKEYAKHAIPAAISMLILIGVFWYIIDDNVLVSLLKASMLWIATTWLTFKLFEILA